MDDDLIYAYTRAQALADGVLVDVTETAREAGFRWPVAVTATLWADIVAIPEPYRGVEDVLGRLWDVVWMARWAAQRATEAQIVYDLVLHVADQEMYKVKMVVGPDDDGSPCITLMRVGED